MANTTMFQALARQFSATFEIARRIDNARRNCAPPTPAFTRLKGMSLSPFLFHLRQQRPDWMADAVYKAHDGELPDDWRFDSCAYLVEQIAEEASTAEDARGMILEACDTLVDPYTHNLLAWLQVGTRWTYLDAVRAELHGGLQPPPFRLFVQELAAAQAYALEQMGSILIDAIDAQARAIDPILRDSTRNEAVADATGA